MKTSHIVIDARAMNSTTGTVLRKLLPLIELEDQTRHYSIIVQRGDQEYWQPKSKNFKIVPTSAPPWSLAGQTRFLFLLIILRPDLVWFFMPDQPVLYRGRKLTTFFDLTMIKYPGKSAKRRWRSYIKMPLGKVVFFFAAKNSAKIMVSSQTVKTELLDRYKIDRQDISIIHCGAEVNPGKTTPFPNKYKKFLLYVGQHGWHKDLITLCDAHQSLLDRYPQLGLIFVGKIDRQTDVTVDYVRSRSYRNVEFTGFLADEHRDWLYREAAAYVFPSLHEGFGLPGLEAMGFGTPVVSSDATCLPEIYGNAAHFFRSGDAHDLARAIGEVLDNPELRRSLSEKGKKRYGCYSYEKMAYEILSLFDELTNPHYL